MVGSPPPSERLGRVPHLDIGPGSEARSETEAPTRMLFLFYRSSQRFPSKGSSFQNIFTFGFIHTVWQCKRDTTNNCVLNKPTLCEQTFKVVMNEIWPFFQASCDRSPYFQGKRTKEKRSTSAVERFVFVSFVKM